MKPRSILFFCLLSALSTTPAWCQFSNASRIWSRNISSAAPTDGQTYVWQASTSSWIAASGAAGTGAIAGTANQITVTGTCASVCTFSLPSGLLIPGTINKITLTAPATGATLTLIDGTTVTGPPASGTMATLAGTENLTNKTVNKLTFTAPATGATLTLIDGTTVTGPAASGTIATLTGTQNLTNTTIGKVTITPVATNATLSLSDGTTVTGPFTSGTLATLEGTQLFTGAVFFNGSVNAGAASSSVPTKLVTTLPATCTVGDQVFKTDATAGQNLYGCTATNTWTQQAGGGGGSGPGSLTNALRGDGSNGFLAAASTDLTDTADLIRNTDVATVTNTMIENPSTTVNGQNCILGSTCTISAGTGDQPSYAASTCSTTASLTASSNTANTYKITLSGNCTSSYATPPATGTRENWQICQASSGGPYSFAWPTGYSTAPTISPIASACTSFSGMWNGSAIIQGNGADSGPLIFASEAAAPGTPPTGFTYCWPDSTDHAGLECKANNSALVYKMVRTGVDITTTTGQVVATHLASALPVAQGGLGVGTITGVMLGNGTSAVTAVSGSGTDCVLVNGTSAACSGGGSGSNVGFIPSVETVVSGVTTSVTVTLNTTLTSATQGWPSCSNSSRVGQLPDSWSVNSGLTTMTINFAPTAAFSGSCTAIVVSSMFIYVGTASGAPSPSGGTPLALFTDSTVAGACDGGGSVGTYSICGWNGATWAVTSRVATPYIISGQWGSLDNATGLTAGTTVAACGTAQHSGTIVSWGAHVSPGGATATFKLWKNNSATTDPTVSNSINTSGIGISSNTRVASTTLSDFTTTTVTAGDNVCVNLSAVSGTPVFAALQVMYQ